MVLTPPLRCQARESPIHGLPRGKWPTQGHGRHLKRYKIRGWVREKPEPSAALLGTGQAAGITVLAGIGPMERKQEEDKRWRKTALIFMMWRKSKLWFWLLKFYVSLVWEVILKRRYTSDKELESLTWNQSSLLPKPLFSRLHRQVHARGPPLGRSHPRPLKQRPLRATPGGSFRSKHWAEREEEEKRGKGTECDIFCGRKTGKLQLCSFQGWWCHQEQDGGMGEEAQGKET